MADVVAVAAGQVEARRLLLDQRLVGGQQPSEGELVARLGSRQQCRLPFARGGIHQNGMNWSWTRRPLRWLGHLARRLEGLPLLLAVAVRSGEPCSDRRLLDDLLDAAELRPLRPPPLGRTAAAALVRARFDGAGEAAFCDARHAATGGNPFLLCALAGSLRAEGVVPRAEAAAAVESFGPDAVARAVARQLERLPAGASELARAVALLGDGAPLRHVAALADLAPSPAARVADALRAAGVLAPTTRLAFAHPVVRAAIEAGMAPGERGLWHERAVGLLRADGAAPERVATHLLRTEPGGRADAVTALRAAADAATARGAPETAAVYLRRALDEGPDPESRPDLLLELGLALAAHAQPGAEKLLREAAEAARDPAARAAAGVRAARALGIAGHFAAAASVCRAALSQTTGMPPDAVARLEHELFAVARMSAASVEEARERLRHPTVDPSPLELWRVMAAFDGTLAGRPVGEVLALLRPALASGALDAEQGSLAVSGAVHVLIWNDELDTARALCEGIAATATRRGWLYTLKHAKFLGSMVALRAGAAREAEADARFALDVKLRSEAPPEAMLWALAPLLDALVERDALDEAEQALQAAGLGEPPPGELTSPLLLEARARLRCAQGRWTEAQHDIQGAAENWNALKVEHPGAALRRAGHRLEAREPLRQALDLAERGGLVRLACRAREELTAPGARPRRAALSGPGALTAAEHRVAALAASGLTNREIAQQLFVTQRTVETHLGHAFQKLDIRSRDRLAAALGRAHIAAGATMPDAALESATSTPA